ncbi:MAG: hypothetical protein IKB23_02215 [Clostridia bacterium]|nr:hypothetical protein [Clostridia bacterium]
MKKRKINPQYLRSITSTDNKDSDISALDFATSIKEFADEYLRGIMTLTVEGAPKGSVSLKLPVVTYLVRLLCENAKDGTMVDVKISLGEQLVLDASYEALGDVGDVAYMVRVAKLAGFDVARSGDVFTFSANIKIDSIMRIYATSMLEFKEMLITTYKM